MPALVHRNAPPPGAEARVSAGAKTPADADTPDLVELCDRIIPLAMARIVEALEEASAYQATQIACHLMDKRQLLAGRPDGHSWLTEDQRAAELARLVAAIVRQP